jgi:diguanylate cyclase (GGDEF)-like protein/PAS domain S-box-containing protein
MAVDDRLLRPDLDRSGRSPLDQAFVLRYLGIVALAIGALVLDFPGWAPAAVLIVGFGLNGVGHHQVRRTGFLPGWVPFADVGGCLVFPAVLPETTLPAVLVMMAVVSLAASLWGPWRAALVVVAGTAGLTAVHLVRDLPDGTVAIAAFTVAGFMVASVVGQLSWVEATVRKQLNTTLHSLNAILWMRDPHTHRFTFVNQQATSILGWTPEQWCAEGFWLDHLHPDDREPTEVATQRGSALGLDHEVTYRFRTADGRWVHLHDRVSAVVDAAGHTTALQGMSLDVTERVRIEQRVSQYADIVERIDLPLLVLRFDDDADALRLVAANPAAEALVRRDLTQTLGRTVEETFPVLAGTRLRARLAAVPERNAALRVEDLVLQLHGGDTRVITLRAFPLPGRSLGVSLFDVTDAALASEALRRQALYDGLTGLPNRRLLDQELHRALRETPLSAESIALLMMDLDQFKEVNDALGHQVGDKLLCEIGSRLDALLDDALVARLGGDEFAVVLVGHVDEAHARRVADRIRATLAEPFRIDDMRLQSNVSIGISLFPSQAHDVATLVQRADVAMYQAKRAGTGTGVAVYAAEADRSSVERLALMGDLAAAAPEGQLLCHFQPIIDLRSGKPVRVEALVRWDHPTLGLLGPERFVELAELSGAIHALTRWVLHESFQAVETWRDAGHHLGLSVNLSMRNLYDPDLLPVLAEMLAASSLSAHELVLELTETELMDDPGLARGVFTALGELGVSTSIDDFGTGYSSLTYLRDLPLQEIKIDRSFVHEMHRHSDEFTIVRSMVDLGHNLGLEVVAEGVERGDDLALLRRLGCDLAQGYYVSHPLPLRDLLAWLDARVAHGGDPQPASPETQPASPEVRATHGADPAPTPSRAGRTSRSM